MSNDANMARVLELVDLVRRSWWTVVAGICVGLAGGVIALHYIPKEYQATATLYHAPPKIPKEYVDTELIDDLEQRLWNMNEAVLSRPYMEQLIDREFDQRPETQDGLDRLIRRIRNRTHVRVSGRRGYFQLTYRSEHPDEAARFANALADLYVEQNIETRSEHARATTETMEERAQAVQSELEKKRSEIEAFKFRHRFELSEYLDTNWRKLESRQRDLMVSKGEISAKMERLEQLQTLLASQRQASPLARGPVEEGVDPYARRLFKLEGELEALLIHYSERHPDVRAKQRELEEWKQTGRTVVTTPTSGEGDDLPPSPLLAQIRDAEKQLQQLRDREAELNREIVALERQIDRTPEVDQQLAELTDGYGLLESKYIDLQRKADDANDAQWLEESQQGRQFQIIEKAEAPTIPLKPQPIRVYGVGLALGLALFVGPLLLSRLLNPVLGSESMLQSLTELPVLVSIPRIDTEEMRRAERRHRLKNLTLSFLSSATLIMVFLTLG